MLAFVLTVTVECNNNLFLPFSVTVARAVELKHKASLISALTNETAKLFTAAGMLSTPILIVVATIEAVNSYAVLL